VKIGEGPELTLRAFGCAWCTDKRLTTCRKRRCRVQKTAPILVAVVRRGGVPPDVLREVLAAGVAVPEL
jgi:hypothetical protein